MGIEGNAARIYFGDFAGMIKNEEEDPSAAEQFQFDFAGRNRRPPRDAVNALLSLAYSLLTKDLTIACYAVGFDPYLGYYHQPRFGRPALALDLMEPFRPLYRRFGGVECDQHAHGDTEGFRSCWAGSGAGTEREKVVFPGVRVADGHPGDASFI